MTISDTMMVYDPNTGKEEVHVVNKEVDALIRIDTISIFDTDTFEETVEIVRSYIPIDKLTISFITKPI